MKQLIYLSLLQLLHGTYAMGQQSFDHTFYDEVWSVKVKQIDDFVDRFNNELNFLKNGSLVKNKFSEDTRPSLLYSLINYEKIKNQPLIDSFVNHIDNNKYLLQLGRDQIDCILTVAASYKQQKFQMNLVLQIEVLDDAAMKWVITDAQSSNYPWKPMASNPQKFINPSNHNLRFSNLFKFINEGNDIQGMFVENFRLDNLSIVVHELLEGNLVIEEIKDINYQIEISDQIKFLVSYFDVPSKPSGWLISEIYK